MASDRKGGARGARGGPRLPGLLNVAIVLARCQKRGGAFGIRFEKETGEVGAGGLEIGRADRWLADWAFPLAEAAGRREGYDDAAIDGSFHFATRYPGCPWCESRGIVSCECGKVACWDGRSESVRCPWCEARSTIGGTIDKLRSGRDRGWTY